jgi:hypothetical protein
MGDDCRRRHERARRGMGMRAHPAVPGYPGFGVGA